MCGSELWFQGGLWVAQGSFLAGFGLSRAALPSAVALSPKKLRGAALTGAYSAQSVHALLDGLFSGRVHTTRFQVRQTKG